MGNYNKTRHNVIIISICMVCVISMAVLICISMSASKKEKADNENKKIIATVELNSETDSKKMTVDKSLFEYMATIIVIENEEIVKELYSATDISTADELKKYTSNFAKEYMIRVLEAKENGVSLSESEKEFVKEQLEADYNTVKKSENLDIDIDEYCKNYFGISQKEYLEFWENWYLIDKYTKLCEEKADISEESQKMAFDEYYDILYTYHVSVIPFPINAENTAEEQKEKATGAKLRLENGESFSNLVKEFVTDETLLASEGKTKYYPAYKDKYEEAVYEWLRVNHIGSVDVIETSYAIYLVKLDDISDFDALINSENMLKVTRSFVVSKELDELLKSDKYKYITIEENYNSVDLSNIVAGAFDHWMNIWENESK